MLSIEILRRLFDALRRAAERRRTRHELLMLSDHMLKDIGLSRGDAYREARKRFWRD